MPDVEVKINSLYPPGASGGIRAYALAAVDGCLGIRGIKVVEGGRDGLFVSMPSRKTENGYKEICFPGNQRVPGTAPQSGAGQLPAGRSHEPSSGATAGIRTGAVPAAHADGRHVTQPQ